MSQPSGPNTSYTGGQPSGPNISYAGGQPSGQNIPYVGGQPSGQNTPYAGGQPSKAPYPNAPPPSSSHTSPFPVNFQPPNTSNYSSHSLPNIGQQPPAFQGDSGFYQTSYPQAYPGNQQPPPPTATSANTANYQNSYPPSNSYQESNPYQSSNPYQQSNPYQPQQGGHPRNNQQQQQPFQNPNASSYPQQSQGGYPQNDPQRPYQQFGGGNNINFHNNRLRAIAEKYEINDALLQRLNILQQFDIVVLCDDSSSMKTPVDGTTGTRWDELRAIVQIIIDIGTIFDSNGVDVHFLNRSPMLNVTDPRQVVESFSQHPQGLTPLTPALRRIFQSGARQSSNNKRSLVFVATDGAPTDNHGNVDIQSLENLMRHERQSNTMYVTFLACTDDRACVNYLCQWDRTMINVDVIDDYKSEREEVRRTKGFNYPFSFGDYVVKALIGAVDRQMDALDEYPNSDKHW
ncbi:unnamed protein product [Rotaria sordida]|uniref:VWFA domain-containing protein n=1 Tax=Rotaria sordida TaxID=392033 RepID=A0A819BIZ5_9BILA|nr:unnamed protein product [Rotaria sordida]CAF1235560.1 unnamed protein product [Rotaria sordida]CAF1467362.1 unnamed protein product [Rotaria sordida]CAF3798949.1 unnamed protein product [Rotaria sordida]